MTQPHARVVLSTAGLAVGMLALLGLLIGWEGASRAYSVGVHTMFRDHLAAVAVMALAGAVVAFWIGRGLVSNAEVALAVAVVALVDVACALLVTLVIDELRRFPMLPRAVFTETAAGLQVVSITLGLSFGRWARARASAPISRPPTTPGHAGSRGPSPPGGSAGANAVRPRS